MLLVLIKPFFGKATSGTYPSFPELTWFPFCWLPEALSTFQEPCVPLTLHYVLSCFY